MKLIVDHWKYNDGWYYVPDILRKPGDAEKEFRPETIGWSCWVYVRDNDTLVDWLKESMTGEYDCTFRFNSGDPMYTLRITSPEDATLFKLSWL
jgi:hypothetical protein